MSVLRDVIVVEQPAYATALLSQFATIEESDDCVIAVEEDMIDVTAIQKLILANCRLKDEHMVGLSTVGSQLEDIFYLNTSFNRLTSVSFMTDLKGLTYLDLSHNKIKTIAPLKSICQQLKVLRINNNDISQLDALSHMCNLVELWCCCNSLPWYEFYNLQSLSSLQQIVLYNNPALEKDEFYSFLCGCCPRLMRIDHHELFPSNANGANGTGAASQSIRSPSNVGNKKLSVQMNFQPTLDFLLTPSGRVMRTQARALLLNNGQQTVGDQIQSPSGESISRRQPANVAGKNGAGPGGVRVSNSGYGNSSRTNAPGGNKRPFTEGEALTGKVVTFKALKNVQNKIAELSSQVLREGDGPSSGDESGGEDIYTENHYSPVMHKVKGKHLGKHGREDGGVSGVGSPNNMLPTRAADGGAMAGLAEVRQKLLFPEEGGVACVVDVNGDGYARWGKIDTLACSFQHRKLFSSYRTGAVAVVLDAGTQVGSVMDNKGNTVLMFSVPQSGEDAAPVARLMNPSNGVVKQVFTRGAPVAKKAAKPKPVSWSADGLTITFDPVSWEVGPDLAQGWLSALLTCCTLLGFLYS